MKCNTIIGTETLKPPSLTAAILNLKTFQSAPIQIDTNQFEEISAILSKCLQTGFSLKQDYFPNPPIIENCSSHITIE